MPNLSFIAAFALLASFASASSLSFQNSTPLTLTHLHDNHQVVLTQVVQLPSQSSTDLTHTANYTSDPPNIQVHILVT